MLESLQLPQFFQELDSLQKLHGCPTLCPIYGAGKVQNPKAVFIFMNPTGRNISCSPEWQGLRAPWIGTKNIWKMFHQLQLMPNKIYKQIETYKPNDWTEAFAEELYTAIAEQGFYITNLAKCTQIDARPLKDSIYKTYLQQTEDEIAVLNPKHVITFGNQVSSILLDKKIKVSEYIDDQHEKISIKNIEYNVYPVYYPVGQGMRNMGKAVERISAIFENG